MPIDRSITPLACVHACVDDFAEAFVASFLFAIRDGSQECLSIVESPGGDFGPEFLMKFRVMVFGLACMDERLTRGSVF